MYPLIHNLIRGGTSPTHFNPLIVAVKLLLLVMCTYLYPLPDGTHRPPLRHWPFGHCLLSALVFCLITPYWAANSSVESRGLVVSGGTHPQPDIDKIEQIIVVRCAVSVHYVLRNYCIYKYIVLHTVCTVFLYYITT